MTARVRAVGALAALVVALAGCATPVGPPPAPTVVSSRPTAGSPTGAAPGGTGPTDSYPPDPGELPLTTPSAPAGGGTLLGRGRGRGPGSVTLARVPPGGSHLTLRLSCAGPGRVWVTDRTGAEIMGTGGCRLGVVYSVSWRSTGQDGPRIAIGVGPTTQWAVDVWLGRPAVAPAPSA